MSDGTEKHRRQRFFDHPAVVAIDAIGQGVRAGGDAAEDTAADKVDGGAVVGGEAGGEAAGDQTMIGGATLDLAVVMRAG